MRSSHLRTHILTSVLIYIYSCNNQSIQELAHELGEDPEEIQDGEANDRNAFVKREHARMEARARIEEDLFTRVPLTKQERKRQNATTRNISSIAAIGDFGDDVADLVERAFKSWANYRPTIGNED